MATLVLCPVHPDPAIPESGDIGWPSHLVSSGMGCLFRCGLGFPSGMETLPTLFLLLKAAHVPAAHVPAAHASSSLLDLSLSTLLRHQLHHLPLLRNR